MRVAAVQCASDLGKAAENRKRITALVHEAAAAGARIIVLPETAITGYLSQDLRTNWHRPGRPVKLFFEKHVDPAAHAETVPGPSTRHFATLAKTLGVYITVPFLEIDRGDGVDPGDEPVTADPFPRYYNTVCLAAPTGEIVAHYRKLTPWPFPEDAWATAGDRGIQCYDTEFGRVGLAICYDIHTILDAYAMQDIWALLYSIAWVQEDDPGAWFDKELPAKIARHGHHVIGANWSVEAEQSWKGYGYSRVITGDGKVLAKARTRQGSEIVYADLPVKKAKAE